MVKVILNEQHTLMEEQETILKERFGNFEIVSVPAEGWTLNEQAEIAENLLGNSIVFASPVPFLLKKVSYYAGYGKGGDDNFACHKGTGTNVFVFHNDNREKIELPNGKIIMSVAKTGWVIS